MIERKIICESATLSTKKKPHVVTLKKKKQEIKRKKK